MLPNLGMSELIVILAIALVIFGAKRVPEIAKSIGQSMNAFKKGLKEEPLAEQPEKPEGEQEKKS